MNLIKLKKAQEDFFDRFPGGFENSELIRIRRHHRLEKMFASAQDIFAKSNFKFPELIVENTSRMVMQSSLISRFEKPKFRDFADALLPKEKDRFAKGLEELLHGNAEEGFETLGAMLEPWKLAKWSLVTIFQAYYRPQTEVFVKPTTTKNIIRYLELNDLHYYPTPAWDFYEQYRATINDMKTMVDPSLSPNSIAFTGFLMRTMPGRLL